MQHSFPWPWWAFPTAAGLSVASIALWPVWAANTTDLDAFWKGSYEGVKKELRGRYPKHEWR